MADEQKLCAYGCGNPALFVFKNGKECCSEKSCMCAVIRKKNSNGVKKEPKPIRNKPELCDYGCGKPALHLFKSGNWGCGKSPNSCLVVKEKNGKSKRGKLCKPHTKEHKLKCKLKAIGRIKSSEHCKNLSKSLTGRKLPQIVKDKIRKTVKNIWKDEEFIKKWQSSFYLKNSPNKPEKKIINILDEIFDKETYVYTGNRTFWVNRRNPDFVCRKEKKIIEFFGDYSHGFEYRLKYGNDSKTNSEHVADRINYFKKYNFDCLIIWEHEMKDLTEVKEKIKKFHNGEK